MGTPPHGKPCLSQNKPHGAANNPPRGKHPTAYQRKNDYPRNSANLAYHAVDISPRGGTISAPWNPTTRQTPPPGGKHSATRRHGTPPRGKYPATRWRGMPPRGGKRKSPAPCWGRALVIRLGYRWFSATYALGRDQTRSEASSVASTPSRSTRMAWPSACDTP